MHIFAMRESQEIPQLPGPAGIIRARDGVVVLAYDALPFAEPARMERLLRACREEQPLNAFDAGEIWRTIDNLDKIV